jgi:hypothetical protein
MKRSSDNPLLAALPHIACCGGPLLIIAVVAGAVSLADIAIALAAIGAIALAGVLWHGRCRACAPARRDRQSSTLREHAVTPLAPPAQNGSARTQNGSVQLRGGGPSLLEFIRSAPDFDALDLDRAEGRGDVEL